ncbi:uncharacterized protein LOC127830931 isoform X2 [Dreissena polymorpha]|uniref:uncharacterized protein LOC127830931 isoform X2 n=1 Tax=Dreissena polymorpha TaxID=45954 RepID=UPI0022652CA2|nr:uncharacterized protein LOC127830931 isoform X2 [Dreissena polymorpha]
MFKIMCRMICVFIVCAWILLVENCDAATTSSPPNTTASPEKTELNCYTCNDVGPTNKCLNFTNFQVAHALWRQSVRDWDDPVQIATCESPFNASCMVLTYNNEKGEVAHLSGCSDDETFGLDPNKSARYLPITKNLQKDNHTRCAWDDTDMICLTLCIGDSDEPCNGPTLAGNFISASGFLIVLCACVQIVNNAFLQVA